MKAYAYNEQPKWDDEKPEGTKRETQIEQVDWLLVGGPLDGKCLVVWSWREEVHVSQSDETHVYVSHPYVVEGKVYKVGLIAGQSIEDIVVENVDIKSLITSAGVDPIGTLQ